MFKKLLTVTAILALFPLAASAGPVGVTAEPETGATLQVPEAGVGHLLGFLYEEGYIRRGYEFTGPRRGTDGAGPLKVSVVGPAGEIQRLKSRVENRRVDWTSYPDVLQDARETADGLDGEVDGEYDFPDFNRGRLSDVLVNIDASGGVSFFDVLNMLSEVSGISIIIDPYLTQDPTGIRRQPLVEGPAGEGGGGPGGDGGFRSGGDFNPSGFLGSGPVYGNFQDVPFLQALDMIVRSQGFRYMIIPPGNDYGRPMIYITSPERMEQELDMQYMPVSREGGSVRVAPREAVGGSGSGGSGTPVRPSNRISSLQMHYADPAQVYRMLGNLGLLPSRVSGWFGYRGQDLVGGGSAGTGGDTGSFGGGDAGGAGGSAGGGPGDGSGFTNSAGDIPLPTAGGGLVVFRGTDATRMRYIERINERGASSFSRSDSVTFTGGAEQDSGPARNLIVYLGD